MLINTKEDTGLVSITRFRDDIDSELSKLNSFNEREDRRIKLDKDTLDKLLFDTFIDKDGIMFKRVAFFSHNLDKLDLSEVSFEDVSFDGDNYDFPKEKNIFWLDFEFTNANIDFSKSYEYKKNKRLLISRFNFMGTNLSNNNLNKLTQKNCGFIKHCNLSNTNIRLSYKGNDGMQLPVYLKIYYTDLRFLDLSDVRIDIVNKRTLDTEISFKSCNLTDTKARLEYYGREDEIIKALESGEVKIVINDLFKSHSDLETMAKYRYLSEHVPSLEEPEDSSYKISDLNKIKTYISSQNKK